MTNPARNYVFRSFQVQYNLILLGGAGLFSLASASLWPLLAALGFEAVWLGLCSRLPSVRRWLDARDAGASEVETETVVRNPLEGLDSEYASRVLALEHGLAELNGAGAGAVAGAVNRARIQEEVAKVGAAFVKMCHAHQRLGRFVDTLPETELSEEVQRLKQAFTAEKDLGLRLGIKHAIELTRRRVEQRRKAVSALCSLSLQLDAVERSVSDLRGQARAVGLNLDVVAGIYLLASELGPESIPAPESDDFDDLAARSLPTALNVAV